MRTHAFTRRRSGVAWCVERYGEDGKGFFTASDFAWAEPDNALFADEQIGPMLMSAMDEALRQGVTGYAQDIIVQGRPWPFAPQAIAAPVHVLHGALDVLVPLAHSRHTSAVILDPLCACSRDTGMSRPWQSSRPWRPLWLAR